jgi:DNA invertase Pin-like site-specific DNA recombinase
LSFDPSSLFELAQRLLDQLAKGDVPMVTRLDRLARSTRDLLNTLDRWRRRAGFRFIV